MLNGLHFYSFFQEVWALKALYNIASIHPFTLKWAFSLKCQPVHQECIHVVLSSYLCFCSSVNSVASCLLEALGSVFICTILQELWTTVRESFHARKRVRPSEDSWWETVQIGSKHGTRNKNRRICWQRKLRGEKESDQQEEWMSDWLSVVCESFSKLKAARQKWEWISWTHKFC